jgi:3-(3-hydroxy-phenyl)propionate hydroxylase
MYFNNAAGETLLIRAGTQERGPHGCATNHYFHQPELEAVLRSGLQRFAQVQVRTSHEVTSLEDGTELATLQVKDLQSGNTQAVQARYVVGCDGARSMVRKVLGTRMRELGLHQPWLVFDVRLKTDVPGLPDHTVQHCDPARPMTYCNVTGNRRRWEIMLMPGDDTHELVKPDKLWPLVKRWIEPQHADIERAVIYTFHSIIAQGWRKGRLLIAGDAAHQTPPFLGQGMCAAVRDVSNLAWKLQAVVQGRADERLLDSYESERAPHVAEFIELAVRLGDIIQTTDPQAARLRDAKFRGGGEPEIFHFPAPRLGPGVLSPAPAPVGQPFPQPQLGNGQWLDERVGHHFVVIATPELMREVQATTLQAWDHWQVQTLDAHDPALASWLAAHHASAVVLRPDRYVMGLAHSSGDLDTLTRECLPTLALPERCA